MNLSHGRTHILINDQKGAEYKNLGYNIKNFRQLGNSLQPHLWLFTFEQ